MKVNKHAFQAICFSLLLTGCNKAIPSEASAVSEINTETKTAQPKVVAISTRLDEIDKLIESIDSEAENITPKEYETSINIGVYACDIKDFGQKKETFCFDGGMKAREILAYYGKDRILKAAIYTIMTYNASAANLSEFDESKTSQIQYKLIFKEKLKYECLY